MVDRNPILVIFIIGVIAVELANADEGQSGATVNKHVAYQKKYIKNYYDHRTTQLKRNADRQVRKMEQAENDELHREALIKSERRINYWGFANPETLTSPERQETTKNRIAERTTAMDGETGDSH